MTDKKYREKIEAFVRELERCVASDDFDPSVFHNIVSGMELVTCRWLRSRRYRHWHFWLKLFFWIMFLTGVVLMLVC